MGQQIEQKVTHHRPGIPGCRRPGCSPEAWWESVLPEEIVARFDKALDRSDAGRAIAAFQFQAHPRRHAIANPGETCPVDPAVTDIGPVAFVRKVRRQGAGVVDADIEAAVEPRRIGGIGRRAAELHFGIGARGGEDGGHSGPSFSSQISISKTPSLPDALSRGAACFMNLNLAREQNQPRTASRTLTKTYTGNLKLGNLNPCKISGQ